MRAGPGTATTTCSGSSCVSSFPARTPRRDRSFTAATTLAARPEAPPRSGAAGMAPTHALLPSGGVGTSPGHAQRAGALPSGHAHELATTARAGLASAGYLPGDGTAAFRAGEDAG